MPGGSIHSQTLSDAARGIRRKALDLLSRRDHSRAELTAKLARRGHPSSEVEAALEALARERLLCDGRFAEAFIAARAGKGSGPLRIAQQLRDRGVAAPDIDRAMQTAAVDWKAEMRAARRKRFGDPIPPEYRDRMRQARFLERRGFAPGDILELLGHAE